MSGPGERETVLRHPPSPAPVTSNGAVGRPREVFAAFLRLGCTAFGGPIAHLGYFQHEFVTRRRWITEEDYADLVALCQFLPGPASSQVGLALGWKRAGWGGALAAWTAFTIPSAILMIAFASGVRVVGDLSRAGWVQGLKVAAAAVVAQAVWTMARKLCPDVPRATIAVVGAAILTVFGTAWMQLAVIGGGAIAGACFGRWFVMEKIGPPRPSTGRAGFGFICLGLFFGLLVLLPWLERAWPNPILSVFDGFYRSGALVFGGGHVVLPLLQQATVARGWLDHDTFLAGYGAAQALPGPLFAFAAYLGAVISPGGILGAILALVAIYLPAALVLFGTLPHWDRLRSYTWARVLLAGANAAVVGLLGAAFYSPIWTSAITEPMRLAMLLLAYGALQFWCVSPWLVVLSSALIGQWLL